MQSRDSSFQDLMNSLVFCAVITWGGLAFLFTPKLELSEGEKRQLAPLPSASAETLRSGNYFRDLEAYVADHFIYRLTLTEWASQIRRWRGRQWDDIEYFSNARRMPSASGALKSDPAADKPAPPSVLAATGAAMPLPTKSVTLEISRAVPAVIDPATSRGPANPLSDNLPTGTTLAGDSTPDLPYQNIESVIVYKNRAFQIMGASPAAATGLAKTLNRYREALGPQAKLYVMPIPVGSDFYLPKKINKGVMREKNLIDSLQAQLNPDIRLVNAYGELEKHIDEYIMFNTDHHWTGLGAYYAYIAFCGAADIPPLAPEAFTHKSIPHFLGSLYQKTLSPDLKANADWVEYWKVPVKTQSQYFMGDLHKGMPASLYAEGARGTYGYGVFLGGDYPMMRISSDNKNGRRIIVVKDSYGNAFAPYLTSHYEDVFILDYRYFNGSILSLMREYSIGELLFAHNTYVISSPYTSSRANGFLKQVAGS